MEANINSPTRIPKLWFDVNNDEEALALEALLESDGDITVLSRSKTKGLPGIRGVVIGKRDKLFIGDTFEETAHATS